MMCVSVCLCVHVFTCIHHASQKHSHGGGVQENAAIGLVVLQSVEFLGLMICFTIHFLCVTIE